MQAIEANAPTESQLEDTVVVSGGRVQKVEEWTNWNGVPGGGWFNVERHSQNFFLCNRGCEEHSGGQFKGTLLQALRGLHESFHSKYISLFNLEGLTPETASGHIDRVMGKTPRKYQVRFA